MSKEPSKKYNVLQPMILGVAIVIGMMAGYKMNEIPEESLVSVSHSDASTSQGSIGRIEELIRYIDSKYITDVNVDKMTEDAIQAVFKSLDPHSIYISPIEIADINTQMNGHYKGIGIENFFIDDTVVVSAILSDSPAEKAGLKPFDKIITINDSIIAGKSLQFDSIRQMLRAESDGAVTLTIMRDTTMKKLTLIPNEIMVPSVRAHYLDDMHTVLVKIDRFGNKTYQEFMLAIEPYFENPSKAKHIILDLRDNPGGYLPEATNILCQLFKEKDKLLVYTEGRNQKRNDYKTNGKAFFNIDKIIVLIDENSASASEIIAGAIQDWDRGIIIGRRSYGKGLVQEQYPLNNGGAIRLTVAKYFTPSGRSIQRDYSDRDIYESDMDERYLHGDLFNKDSSIVKNNEIFKTLSLSRVVKASGGITPDIFVSMDTIFKNPHIFKVYDILKEFTFRFTISHRLSFPTIEKLMAWQIPDSFYNEFMQFGYENEKVPFLLKDLHHLDTDVKEIMAKYLFGEAKAEAYNLKNDPFIKKAEEAIKQNFSLSDLK